METKKLERKDSVSKTDDSYSTVLCNTTGAIVSVLLTIFFMSMKLFGLHEILALRYLNFIFLLGGVLFVLSKYKRKTGGSGVEYLKGIKMGLQTTMVAVVPFAVFMCLYLSFDTGFMDFIKHTSEFGSYLNPLAAAGVALIEGTVSGAILTFIFMPYFKEK